MQPNDFSLRSFSSPSHPDLHHSRPGLHAEVSTRTPHAHEHWTSLQVPGSAKRETSIPETTSYHLGQLSHILNYKNFVCTTWQLTSSSHCRCLSRLAMSSGVSPASLAKYTQKHISRGGYTGLIHFRKHHRRQAGKNEVPTTTFCTLGFLCWIWLYRQDKAKWIQTACSQKTLAGIWEEIPWHRFTHPHTYTRRTARPHMTPCYLFFPFLVDRLSITKQHQNYKSPH